MKKITSSSTCFKTQIQELWLFLSLPSFFAPKILFSKTSNRLKGVQLIYEIQKG